MLQKIKKVSAVPVEIIQNKIFIIRGHKIMFDKDLAEMYGVPTRRLKEQVRRNLKRFPKDFMFELTWDEAGLSRSQFATLNQGKNIKYLPYAFTEQGVAMLSGMLNSDRAIEVNIQIMRVFVRLKELVMSHKDLARKIEDLERKFGDHDAKIIHLFNEIRRLLATSEPLDNYKRTKVGFIAERHA